MTIYVHTESAKSDIANLIFKIIDWNFEMYFLLYWSLYSDSHYL